MRAIMSVRVTVSVTVRVSVSVGVCNNLPRPRIIDHVTRDGERLGLGLLRLKV